MYESEHFNNASLYWGWSLCKPPTWLMLVRGPMDRNVGWNGMLFTMICTCPFLQESGEFSLSSLHPPIRQRTASCTWGEGNKGWCVGRVNIERERGRGKEWWGRGKGWCKGKKLVEELLLSLANVWAIGNSLLRHFIFFIFITAMTDVEY